MANQSNTLFETGPFLGEIVHRQSDMSNGDSLNSNAVVVNRLLTLQQTEIEGNVE